MEKGELWTMFTLNGFGGRSNTSGPPPRYVYLNPPNGGVDLYKGVKAYVKFYNGERKHTGTGYFPDDLFFGCNAKVS